MTNTRASEGIGIGRIYAVARHNLFSDVEEKVLIEAFLENRKDKQEEQRKAIKKNEGKTIIEMQSAGFKVK